MLGWASDGDTGAATGQTASALDVVAKCDASLTCIIDTNIQQTLLTKDASGCHMGKLTLAPGGDVESNDVQGFHWTATSATVWFCTDDAADGCMVCTENTGSTTSSSAPAGKCTGVARGCSSYGPGSCSSHDGCSMDLDFEYCEGAAKACFQYTAQHGCEEQDGCEWN